MSEKIRPVKASDLFQLQELYKKRKCVPELNWLLQDPDVPDKLNGYVAENKEGRIVGMIGFISSIYKYGDNEIVGVIPMSWKIEDGYKGLAGIQLFKKVLQHGEFNLTIEGSEIAQSMYSMFGLTNIGYSHTCMKLIKPLKYYLTLENKSLYKRIGNLTIMLQSYIKRTPKLKNILKIKEVDVNSVNKDIPYIHKTYMEKYMTANFIKWLLNCPVNESYGFEIFKDEAFIGYSVCYIHKINNKYNRGRIVYMPNFGHNWLQARELIAYLTRFLQQKGCVSISLSLMDRDLLKVTKASSYIDYTLKDKPIFVKPSNILETLGVDVNKWYMQYTEGDKAYRNI
ncbi:hypothetical protein [Plebeiibacterium sediminum]|uniref:Uncharacterized protein n=1 Tax=Plebeiibacterium sediminum TaxID=2992112 RepID=A0AAE3M3T6_9BACT|nr:hypothetical protein [Plebeiobacterium sediminum]MCW3786235.1 hypothetical protein [Plebeiobacterium sediminum]